MTDLFNEKKVKGLSILRASTSSVSGEDISRELNVSRAAVWKYIEALRKDGYKIEGISNQGYLLKGSPDELLSTEIRPRLPDAYKGEIYFHEELESTNDEARRLAQEGAPSGTLVIAKSQKGGRGRRGRAWQSPVGGIWFSVILRPDIPLLLAPRVSVFTAVIVAESISLATGLKTAIKWPNDIFTNDKKICGILIELSAELDRVGHMVIGIGINANISGAELTDDVKGIATTLMDEMGKKIDRKALVASIATRYFLELEKVFTDKYQEYLESWRKNSLILGRVVSIEESGKETIGEALDIEENGALIVRLSDGRKKVFHSGDVSLKLRDS